MHATIVQDWKEADRRLERVATAKKKLDHEVGRALLDAHRAGAHTALGFATFSEYAERRFGFSPRDTRERLRVARALEELPRVDEALAVGSITWSAARELARCADEETEESWLEAAQRLSQRDLEYKVARRLRGDRPDDPPRADLREHRVGFKLSGAAYALYRECEAALTRDYGEELSPDELFILMCRRILEGPGDAGRSSYQISITQCPDCRETTQIGRGEPIRIDAAEMEMAECDAVRIDGDGHAAQDIPPSTRRSVMLRDHGQCVVPGCRNATWVDLHHILLKSEGGAHDAENLATLCAGHHRALHRGSLFLSGRPSTGLQFRHADGSPYGGSVDPSRAEVATEVFQALRHWGVKEGTARRCVSQAMTRAGRALPFDTLLRQSLCELRR